MSNELILYFDIETLPNLVYSYGIRKQFISHEQMFKESQIACISWIFEQNGKLSKTYNLKLDLKKYDLLSYDDDADRELLVKFSKVYNNADLIVAHNGKSFDIAVLTARIIRYQLPPLRTIAIDDTYKMTKMFRFNSHKLDYLSSVLLNDRKIKTTFQLWVDICRGKKQALKDMVAYCDKDVALLPPLYKLLLPYVDSVLNRAHFTEDKSQRTCVACGGHNLEARGYKYTKVGSYRQYKCYDCGSWKTRERKSLATTLMTA